jgi:hypothetical protein
MSDYIGVVTNAGQAKIAAAIGGAALNLTTVRVGDGNGAPIALNPTMTDLVRRVGAAYPIVSSGRDPVNANHWRITTLIPVADGPFDIREIGVWDAAGELIAIARHVLVEKRSPAQGAAVELLTDIVFPVSDTAQVTVQIQPAAAVSIMQMLRAGFTVVESAIVTAPPGAPALGRTHIVPADPTGAWNGLAGNLVQWNGIAWVAVNVPVGFLVVAQDKALDDPLRWLRRTAGGWTSAEASETAYGLVRRATAAEVAALADVSAFLSPGDVAAAVAANKTTFNTKQVSFSARTSLSTAGFASYKTGTYVKKSPTSDLIVEMSTNVFSASGQGATVMRMSGLPEFFDIVVANLFAGTNHPAANGKRVFPGIAAGPINWALSFGRFDATVWQGWINPNETDQAYLPPSTSTSILFEECEPS